MAKIEFEGLEEYRARIKDLGLDIDGICKYAVYDAAGMVIEAIKANTPADSGDLRESAALYNFKNEDGFIHTGVYFPGYDSKGVPNAIKARVLESGNSTHKKQPFIRPAVNRVKNAAVAAIKNAFESKVQEYMKE